ncbi:twin-arginine translocation signal domain-containing protein, partial [Klebsiella pneumoniae]
MGDKFSISRRRLLQAGAALGGAMLLPGVMPYFWSNPFAAAMASGAQS